VVGDARYAGERWRAFPIPEAQARSRAWRYATALGFRHPETGSMQFRSPLPQDLERCWRPARRRESGPDGGGGGRLARAVVPVRAGYGPVLVLSPARSARTLARGRRGVPRQRWTLHSPTTSASCSSRSDDRLAAVAGTLARSGISWRGRGVLHTAGALGPGPLAMLARRGALTGVLHPLQVLGGDAIAARARLRGTLFRIEGTPRARRLAARLARDLGGIPVAVPGRVLYHAAASLASNDVVALLGLAATALERAGLTPARARLGALRLAEGALLRSGGRDRRGADGPVAREMRARSRAARRSPFQARPPAAPAPPGGGGRRLGLDGQAPRPPAPSPPVARSPA
jgi:predicted short-subunit dehydrogenase-like oxidoreductase (DUF2520 family)